MNNLDYILDILDITDKIDATINYFLTGYIKIDELNKIIGTDKIDEINIIYSKINEINIDTSITKILIKIINFILSNEIIKLKNEYYIVNKL